MLAFRQRSLPILTASKQFMSLSCRKRRSSLRMHSSPMMMQNLGTCQLVIVPKIAWTQRDWPWHPQTQLFLKTTGVTECCREWAGRGLALAETRMVSLARFTSPSCSCSHCNAVSCVKLSLWHQDVHSLAHQSHTAHLSSHAPSLCDHER